MTYYLLSFFLRLFSYVPFCLLYIISDGLYFLVYYVFRYRRRIVRKNLTESFPEKSEDDIKKIEKNFYSFFTDNILESLKMFTISRKEMLRRVKFVNVEEVDDLMRNGKSISLFLGHYGNWEWMSSIPLHINKEVVAAQIYHKLSNKNMDRLMLYVRERMGAVCVEMRKTARYVNELATENKV